MTNVNTEALTDEALDEVVGGLAQQSLSHTLQNVLHHESPIFNLIHRILDPRMVTLPVHLPPRPF